MAVDCEDNIIHLLLFCKCETEDEELEVTSQGHKSC